MTEKRPSYYDDPELGPEARAFDQRIKERIEAGFVPDLQNAVHCDYFYKSFWRDPLFIDLYEGEVARTYTRLLSEHCGKGLRILDVGCGAGYVSLELARSGHHVVGIDISCECIEVAKSTAASAPKGEAYGSLEYRAAPLSEISGKFDIVLFSVALHHFPNIDRAIDDVLGVLKPDGFLLCCEPCHETWREEDAAQVALIRSLLRCLGAWHDVTEGTSAAHDQVEFRNYARAVLTEYAEERDPHETAQSPNDLEQDGSTILKVLRARFSERAFEYGASFIYRLLGGIRGDASAIQEVAKLLAVYDKYAVGAGIIRPNFFFFLGRREG